MKNRTPLQSLHFLNEVANIFHNPTTSKVADIIRATKGLTFDQATFYIEKTSGLKVERINTISTSILWRVNGNKEICYISNSYKSLVTGMSDVRAVWN